jgi:hypothetical protein
MKMYSALVVALTLALGPTTASAAQIFGEVSFDGGGSSFQTTGGSIADGTATGIDFLGGMDPMGSIEVTSSTGDFASNGAAVGTSGTITDFTFDPFVGPINDFWSIGGFTFDLEALPTVQFLGGAGSFTALFLEGSGTVEAAGFDPTHGTWVWTGNTSGQTFSFSASTLTQPIPVPATVGLLGLGLLGLGGVMRLRSKAA